MQPTQGTVEHGDSHRKSKNINWLQYSAKISAFEKSKPNTLTSRTLDFGSAQILVLQRTRRASPDLTSAEPTLKYRQPSGDVDLTRSGRSSDRIYEANPAVLSSREEKQHGSASTPVCASCRAMKTRNSSSALNVARYSSPANSKI